MTGKVRMTMREADDFGHRGLAGAHEGTHITQWKTSKKVTV